MKGGDSAILSLSTLAEWGKVLLNEGFRSARLSSRGGGLFKRQRGGRAEVERVRG